MKFLWTALAKSPFWGLRGLFLLLVCIGCDSGDIYPDDITEEETVNLAASFDFKGLESFPSGDYNLILGAFENNKAAAVNYVRLSKPLTGTKVEVSLANVSAEAETIKLYLATSSNQVVYTFYQRTINSSSGNNIVIPEQKIHLSTLNRLQNQLFTRRCVSCHGTQAHEPSAGLDLGPEHCYANLINIASTSKPGTIRVIPNDSENSFITHVLTEESALPFNHVQFLGANLKEDDLTLLREWIKDGALNN